MVFFYRVDDQNDCGPGHKSSCIHIKIPTLGKFSVITVRGVYWVPICKDPFALWRKDILKTFQESEIMPRNYLIDLNVHMRIV